YYERSTALRREILLFELESHTKADRPARARNVYISWHGRGGMWEMEVCDDGVGLGPDAFDPSRRGRGLRGMRRRAEEIGASIQWLPNPGGGTCMRLLFPVKGRFRLRLWRRSKRTRDGATDARWKARDRSAVPAGGVGGDWNLEAQ